MNTNRIAAISRAIDAAICWAAAPKWCRGKLVATVRRAYRRAQDLDRSGFYYA